jgi:hypothetical protein
MSKDTRETLLTALAVLFLLADIGMLIWVYLAWRAGW